MVILFDWFLSDANRKEDKNFQLDSCSRSPTTAVLGRGRRLMLYDETIERRYNIYDKVYLLFRIPPSVWQRFLSQ